MPDEPRGPSAGAEEASPEAAAARARDLVARIRAGDRTAEGEMVEHYGPGLGFLLRRWTRSPGLAQDLYQETFRLALAKIRGGELREPARLAAFLRGLAKNLSRHAFRGPRVREIPRGHGTELEEALPRAGDGSPFAGPAPFADPAPSGPLQTLLRRERAALVRRLLAELPVERDRQLLTRYYLAEESREQICTGLDLDPDHFKRVLFRARNRYRALYEAAAAAGSGPGSEPS